MEDKKSMFASSLIQNVLSKKIQFEQERRMERGEISEPRQRQTSRTECALMRVHEPADCVSEESCSDPLKRDGPDLEPQNGAGVSAKTGSIKTSKSALLRSQNSAFRSWNDRESGSAGGTWTDRNTKTSHLFVPSIQLMSAQAADEGRRRSDVTNFRSLTSNSPEIKINLRSVRGESSRIRTDQVLAATLKGDSADKVPHFIIRDIRDSKGKLQTPIHQVRDIRKLVKSSYHFVSLDNGENKSHSSSADIYKKQKDDQNMTSGSLIVIKCQSVNTSSTGIQPGNVEFTKHELSDTHEGRCAQGGRPGASEGGIAVKATSNTASRKQEKVSEIPENIPNQVALEKIQAAVKSMEQLYVFQKNKWRRKTDVQSPSDGGILVLNAGEGLERPKRQIDLDRMIRGDSCSMEETIPGSQLRQEHLHQVLQTSSSSSNLQASSIAHILHPNTNRLVPESPTTPSKTCQSGINSNGIKSQEMERLEGQFLSSSADSENYLSIPVKPHPHNSKTGQSAVKTSLYTPQPCSTSPLRHDRWSSIGLDYPTSLTKQEGSSSRGPEDITSPQKHEGWNSRGPEDPTIPQKHDKWSSICPEDPTSLTKHEGSISRGPEDISPQKHGWRFSGPEDMTTPLKHNRSPRSWEDPTSSQKHEGWNSRDPEDPNSPLKHNRWSSIGPEDPTSPLKHDRWSPRSWEDPTSPLKHDRWSSIAPDDPTSPLKHDRWSSIAPDDPTSPLKHDRWSSIGPEDSTSPLKHDRWSSIAPYYPTSPLKHDRWSSIAPDDPTSPLKHDRWSSIGPEDPTSPLKHDRWSSIGPEDTTSLTKHEGLSSRGPEDPTSPLKHDRWSPRSWEDPTSPQKHDGWSPKGPEDPSSPPKHDGWSSRGLEDHSQQIRCSSMGMETHPQEVPHATVHHPLPLGMATSQAQVYCFSPAVTPAPTLDPFQATQRKMLLDPTTGNYYLVDTPVPPATKCLFDPETGQYVEVPLPQPPMAPVSISPVALSPAAYGHTYMFYPGFMPTPSVVPARALFRSQLSAPLKEDGMEDTSSQHAEGLYMDSPFYMKTVNSPRAIAQQAATGRFQRGFNTPLISITSQQRPRIVAPPLFHGTTMSFVVEHR